jgi:glucose/arabinose dehydrogenase
MEQPLYYWDPSIAPSGMAFYTSDVAPQWKGNLFVGALAQTHLTRLVLDGEAVTAEEKLLTDLNVRIRDVRQGPDGAIYVATDSPQGQILRVTPES